VTDLSLSAAAFNFLALGFQNWESMHGDLAAVILTIEYQGHRDTQTRAAKASVANNDADRDLPAQLNALSTTLLKGSHDEDYGWLLHAHSFSRFLPCRPYVNGVYENLPYQLGCCLRVRGC
jgi:hypothetical protein